MKKIFTLLIALFWISVSMIYARTQEEAAALASQFIAERTIPTTQRLPQRVPQTVDWAFTQYQMDATTPAVYVFNTGKEDGFVLVSAKEQARAILGYADEGTFDANNIPDNMRFWLQMYADELSSISDAPAAPSVGRSALQRTKRLAATSNDYPTIAPIIGNVHWGQDAPYNDSCPVISAKKTPVGCVATAIGQIMYHHKYPAQGTGSHSYKTESYNLSLSANFGATTYDWENILPVYKFGEYSATQAKAVATLLSHVGIASDMNYQPGASGAFSPDAMLGLINHFNYDKGITPLLKDYMGESHMLQAIADELQKGRPVYMGGGTVNGEGHAFVCDGMQSNGYLHINWGWNGDSDGYFAISALDPDAHGTGGSASNLAFTEYVEAYTGIQPDQGGTEKTLMTAGAIERLSADMISRYKNIQIQVCQLMNLGLTKSMGVVEYRIYDEDQQLVKQQSCSDYELKPQYYYDCFDMDASVDDLANGAYELEIACKDNHGQYHPIYVKNKGVVRIPFTLTSTHIIFDETEAPEAVEITMADLVFIDGTTQWVIDLYSSNFWDGPSDSDILIRCTVNSSSQTSVLGTYVMDYTNSGEVGTIQPDVLYAVGYYQDILQHYPSDLHLTITEAEDGNLELQYYMVVNDEVHHKTCIVTPRWAIRKGENVYYYDEYITYDLASAISASLAKDVMRTFGLTDTTHIAYFVNGIVSNMRNTPSEIAASGVADFDISDDGGTTQQLYCGNIRWLDSVAFATGNEIQVGDELVVYGRMQYHDSRVPEISGYVYASDREPEEETDYSIEQLELITVHDKHIALQWVTNALQVEIKLFDSSNAQVASTLVNGNSGMITAPDWGTYTVQVQAMSLDDQYLSEPVRLTVDVVDNSIHNLQVAIDGNKVTASWTCAAPFVHVCVYALDNVTVIAELITDHQAVQTELEAGTYTLWLRPLDAAQEYYVSEVVEVEITISDPETAVEDVQVASMIHLYDLMGRLIDSKHSSDPRPWNISHNGIYIQQSQHTTEKVHLTAMKQEGN